MSEYRRHGLDPSSAWSTTEGLKEKEKENRSDLVSQVQVRPRNTDIREQLESSEFGLLDLRLAQQRGEAKVLVQQQQLLEDQVEQITLQRQQAARLGLAAVADALQPAESSVRQAAAEVLNRQHMQQEQAAAQAALVEEAGRWRRQVWAAHEAEAWAATQESNRAVAALEARCAAVAADIREASRLGLASAEELTVAWASLDEASTVNSVYSRHPGPAGSGHVSAGSVSEHTERVNELGDIWAAKLALGAAATAALAGQRQQLLQEELQAQAEQLMAEEEERQQEQRQSETQRRRALLSPRRRASRQQSQPQQQPQPQSSAPPPPQPQAQPQASAPPQRRPLQVQTEAQAQAQAEVPTHVQRYQQRFEQYQLEKAIQKEKERAQAKRGKVKPPGGRHTAARALLRRRRPLHSVVEPEPERSAAAPVSSGQNQLRKEAAARIKSKDEEIKRIQADALRTKQQQEQAEQGGGGGDGGGGGEDSPGTREVRELLVASAAVRRSVSAGQD
jgi:hypothetical protein